jgi:hypothetical protein
MKTAQQDPIVKDTPYKEYQKEQHTKDMQHVKQHFILKVDRRARNARKYTK